MRQIAVDQRNIIERNGESSQLTIQNYNALTDIYNITISNSQVNVYNLKNLSHFIEKQHQIINLPSRPVFNNTHVLPPSPDVVINRPNNYIQPLPRPSQQFNFNSINTNTNINTNTSTNINFNHINDGNQFILPPQESRRPTVPNSIPTRPQIMFPKPDIQRPTIVPQQPIIVPKPLIFVPKQPTQPIFIPQQPIVVPQKPTVVP